MNLSKWRMAAAVDRFPFVLRTIHAVWRLSRPHFSAGAIGVVLNPLGEVLVVEHVYHLEPRWGLPGGYVDNGEDPQEAIVRELREELELDVRVIRVVLIERGGAHHLDIAYLCHTGDDVGHLCDELLDYRWVHPDQLPRMRSFHFKAVREALALLDVKA